MQNIIHNVFKTLAYPPGEDQLKILTLFFNNLAWLRIIMLAISLFSLFFWYQCLIKVTNKKVALISVFFILFSPAYYVLWLSYPFDCLRIFVASLLLFLFRNKFNKLLMLLSCVFLISSLFYTSSERSSFYHKIGLKDAKVKVQERFDAEDSLTNPIFIPLNIKRIVYNKYYFAYKEAINEVIPFFDMESLFFQEVHPMEQKSIVIFVWPQLFLLIGGSYLLVTRKNKKVYNLLLITLFFSFINFLFSPFNIFRKFEFILFPLSLVMAFSVEAIIKSKIVFNKFTGGVLIFLTSYGIVSNHVDLNKRPDFWLDNRPYFYDFVFNSIKIRDWQNFDKIYISSLVGRSKEYCEYYLKDCSEDKFIFNSFDLKNMKADKNSIYAGFSGEFIGSDFYNHIDNDWYNLTVDKGFSKIDTIKIRDTIAYKYGNHVLVGEVK